MPRPKVQVGSVRGVGEVSVEEGAGLPSSKKYKWEFQSKASNFLLSLKDRILHWGPSGNMMEEFPKTKLGSRLDWIPFEDSYFGTNDKDLADALLNHPDCKLPSEGGKFWLREAVEKVQREAEVAALRERLSKDPALAAAVLKPSNADDFVLPQPTA